MPITKVRRQLLATVGSCFATGLLANDMRGLDSVWSSKSRVINVLDIGADSTGVNDASAVLQTAIDLLSITGGILYFPAGTYRVDRTLQWSNRSNGRQSGMLFVGDGMHSTIIKSHVKHGPLMRVRGIPQVGPISTTFFWGGGIQQMTLDGFAGSSSEHDAIEITGWWYGEIKQVRIVNFSRHGIRTVTDLTINSNPDFSASTLSIKWVWVERCGGWGFKDDGGVQGSPAFGWDRVVFVLCALGGAYVQSSSHGFTKCSFSQCGWRNERDPPATSGYGLYFDGAATASSRHWVEGCEFDNSLTAHVALRYCTASSFINNRFIANDRQNTGRLCPSDGVVVGDGDARAAVRAVEFRQSFFRIDRVGATSGFYWANLANVRDVTVVNSIFSDNTGEAKIVRHRGLPLDRSKFNLRLDDHPAA